MTLTTTIDGFKIPNPPQVEINPVFKDEDGLNAPRKEGRFQIRNNLASYGKPINTTITPTKYIVVEINGKRYQVPVVPTTEKLT